MVDGYRSKLVNVVSGVPQWSILGPLLFLLYTSELFSFLKISWSVMQMTILLWLLCHPKELELQWQSPRSVTSARLVSGVAFGEWNWMRVRLRRCSLQVTHSASQVTLINCWRNCVEGVWWPWFIGSDIWLQDDLWEASSLGYQSSFKIQRILRKSWLVFHARSFLVRFNLGFVLLVLEYCSDVLCSAADIHRKVLDRVVSCSRFQTAWGWIWMTITHRRSVAAPHRCMLYKIRSNLTHPLYGFLPVSVKVTLGTFRISVYLAAEPRSTTWPLFSSQFPCGTILLTMYWLVWDWWISRAKPMLFYWPNLLYHFLSSTIFPFLFFLSLAIGCYCGAGVFGLIGCGSLSPNLALTTSFINTTIIINISNIYSDTLVSKMCIIIVMLLNKRFLCIS